MPIQNIVMSSSILLEAANQFGTPTYFYDLNVTMNQYRKLYNAFKPLEVQLHYALKALNNINILRVLKSEGAGLDAVSIEEIHLGLRAGYAPEKIMYTPNCVSFSEIQEAVELGVHINLDNLSMLEKFGNEYGSRVPVCIRVNPHIMAGGNANISVGHIDSKFGISIHQIPLLLRIVENTRMNINGIHMHTGSDILDIDVFLYASEILFEVAKKFKKLKLFYKEVLPKKGWNTYSSINLKYICP